jgi:hypothetical protein
MHDPLENVGRDLDEARAKIDATRAVLDLEPFREIVARLDRIAAELERVRGRVSENDGLPPGSSILAS